MAGGKKDASKGLSKPPKPKIPAKKKVYTSHRSYLIREEKVDFFYVTSMYRGLKLRFHARMKEWMPIQKGYFLPLLLISITLITYPSTKSYQFLITP